MSGNVAAPKIFVIPQSLLTQSPAQTQTAAKSLLKISPRLPAATTQRVMQASTPFSVYSPVTTNIKMATVSNNNMLVKPVAAVTGHKRPAPVSSPLVIDLDIKNESEDEYDDNKGEPVRKRANLDHLSPEERLMRRKLKNRVAAQTARDKKRAYLDEMEIVVRELREERRRILQENSRLQASNNQLKLDNKALINENKDLRSRVLPEVKIENDQQELEKNDQYELPLSPYSLPHELPLSPLSLPRSPQPQSVSPPLRPSTQRPPESAELTSAPQQQEQGQCVEVKEPGLGLSSSDLTTCPALCVMWWTSLVMAVISQSSTAAFLAVINKNLEKQPKQKQQQQSQSLLPIKKRGVSHWWGVEKRGWNPTMKESPPE